MLSTATRLPIWEIANWSDNKQYQQPTPLSSLLRQQVSQARPTPLTFNPDLAAQIGVNEAIVLQRLHECLHSQYRSIADFLARTGQVQFRGCKFDPTYQDLFTQALGEELSQHQVMVINVRGTDWLFKGTKQWQQDFPWLSESAIRRVFTKLESVEVISMTRWSKLAIVEAFYFMGTRLYSINYEKLTTEYNSPLYTFNQQQEV